MVWFVSRSAAVFVLAVACNFAFAAAQERQLSASGEGVLNWGSRALNATCEVPHLGHSQLSIDYWDDFLRSGLLFPGQGVLRSASDDELGFVFDAEVYVFDQATGVVATTATINWGTGRFTGATGSINLTFDFDPNFELFSFEIDGLIDY